MSDKIRLAEAMGWTVCADGKTGFEGDSRHRRILRNPFTDANDDYAVLEWMRNKPDIECASGYPWTEFMHMNEQEAHQYQIGDYARAALKVIE